MPVIRTLLKGAKIFGLSPVCSCARSLWQYWEVMGTYVFYIAFCCGGKCHAHKQLEEERVYLAYIFRSQSITERNQVRISSKNLEAETMKEDCRVTRELVPVLLRPTCPWMGEPQWTAPTHISHQSRQFLTNMATCQSEPGNSSTEVPPSLMTLGYVQVTGKSNAVH